MTHSHAIKDNSGMIAGIAALSAGIGAITALMITPRTGQELRGGLKRRAVNAKETIANKFERTKDETAEITEDIKDKAKDASKDIKIAAKSTATKARAKKADLS
jgi:gas vesicle protein